MPTFSTIIQHSSGSSTYTNQQRKRKKRNPDQKRRSKTLTVCRWHDTVHNPKDSSKKLLELISEFSKFAGYIINTQKSFAFLYTNNEDPEREIKKIKYLGINLPKEAKELYTENYRH